MILEKENVLLSNFFGKKVHKNLKLTEFKKGKENWLAKENEVERKRTMFDDILRETGEGKTKKKKKSE